MVEKSSKRMIRLQPEEKINSGSEKQEVDYKGDPIEPNKNRE